MFYRVTERTKSAEELGQGNFAWQANNSGFTLACQKLYSTHFVALSVIYVYLF